MSTQGGGSGGRHPARGARPAGQGRSRAASLRGTGRDQAGPARRGARKPACGGRPEGPLCLALSLAFGALRGESGRHRSSFTGVALPPPPCEVGAAISAIFTFGIQSRLSQGFELHNLDCRRWAQFGLRVRKRRRPPWGSQTFCLPLHAGAFSPRELSFFQR